MNYGNCDYRQDTHTRELIILHESWIANIIRRNSFPNTFSSR